jgi:hypothetical protein
LSKTAAAGRLQRDGYSELPSAQPRSIAAIALLAVSEQPVACSTLLPSHCPATECSIHWCRRRAEELT